MREAGQRLTSFVRVSVSHTCGLTALSLRVSMCDAMIAQLAPPSSVPAKSALFSTQGDRPNGALDGVGVDLDAAVLEEAAVPVPTACAISYCLRGDLAGGFDLRGARCLEQGPASSRT